MSEQKVQKKSISGGNLLAQAGILAAAGIVSRIIGLLYRSPLAGVIGDLGLGYYQEAYAYYTIVLLVSSYSIPSAVSKVIAQRLALQEYRNAHRLFWGAMIYALVIGGIASLFLFFGAGLFVEDAAIPVLRVFAPTIFIYGILGVLRGYFQAHKSMVQTSVSQILEQIANAVVSVGAAYLLIRMAFGSLEMPVSQGEKILRAARGAMGSAIGTGVGVLTGLIVMLIAYLRHRPHILERVREDQNPQKESVLSIIKAITFVVTPFILSTAIYNLSDSVNTKIFTDFYPSVRGISQVTVGEHWGVFSGKANTIAKIPIAFATAMASAMLPSIAQLAAAKKMEEVHAKIALAVKATMLISIPSAVGLFVLAKPVTLLLFPSTRESLELATYSLMALSVSVIFYALSTLNSSILQGIGKVNTPIVNAAIALVMQTLTAVVLLFFTDMDLYSIAIASTLYAAVMAYLNQRSVRRAIGYQQELSRSFLRPLLASLLMGCVAWGGYQILLLILHSMRLAVIPAIIIAAIVYIPLLFVTGTLTENELRSFPKGGTLVKAAKKCHLLR